MQETRARFRGRPRRLQSGFCREHYFLLNALLQCGQLVAAGNAALDKKSSQLAERIALRIGFSLWLGPIQRVVVRNGVRMQANNVPVHERRTFATPDVV